MMVSLRILALVATSVAAYVLLRGWPENLPALVRGCLAVLALVAGIGLWARRPQFSGPVARGRRIAGWLDYSAVAMAVLALECGFLWLFIAAPKPLEKVALSIEQRFLPASAARRVLEDASGEMQTGHWLWNDQRRRPLPRRTNLKPGNRPEVFLRANAPQDVAELSSKQIYVRSFVLGRYERAIWSAADGTRMELTADDSGEIALVPPELRSGRLIRHEVFHAADPGGQNVLTALQGVGIARLPELSRLGDGFHLLPPPTGLDGYQYMAASRPLRIDDLPKNEEILPVADASPELLEIPVAGNFGRRLRIMTLAAAGNGTLLERLIQARDHLRNTYGYSLQTTNSLDLDPLENFLFTERRGHCEYFASAGALMARVLGVPSRVAYGWAGGTYYESSNMFVFRSREAHAWTEVWLDGLGWVVMDPTPPPAIGGDRARQAEPDEEIPAPMAEQDDEEQIATADNGGTIALWLLAGFSIPALILGCMRAFKTKRRPGIGAAPHGGPESPGYLIAWQRALARHGLPTTAGTPLRRQMREARPRPPFEEEMWIYHYGTRYGDRPHDPKFEKHLIRLIREWEASESGNSGIKPASTLPIPADE